MTTRTVTATYVTPDGRPQRGTVSFRLSRFVEDPATDGTWITSGFIRVPLTDEGDLEVELLASDDATVAWLVREDFAGGRKFWVAVPESTPDPVMLANLTVVSADPSTEFVAGPQGIPGITEAVWSGQDARPLVGTHRWYADRDLTIDYVRVSLGVAPTLAPVVVDVNAGSDNAGSASIFDVEGDRPVVAIGEHDSGQVTPTGTTTLAEGEYLTVDVDDGVDGSGITVQVRLH